MNESKRPIRNDNKVGRKIYTKIVPKHMLPILYINSTTRCFKATTEVNMFGYNYGQEINISIGIKAKKSQVKFMPKSVG